MAHAFGTNLGSICSVETMRLRCVCDAHSGCWHLRKANGGPMPRGHQTVWIYGGRYMTPTRAMWELVRGKPVPKGRIVWRKCDSYDCVNPKHLRIGSKRDEVRFNAKRGAFSSTAQIAAVRAAALANRKITTELRQWLVESPQTGVDAAHGLGISQGRANAIRQEMRRRVMTSASSIFAVGDAMNEPQRQVAA